MTQDQEMHIERLTNAFNLSARKKYAKGVEQHGGNLWEKGIIYLIEQAIEENIDQFIYLTTCREELNKVLGYLPKPTSMDMDKK